MACLVFVGGGVETRVINSNLKDTIPQNSYLAVKETEENRSVKEANSEANIIWNLTVLLELSVKISQTKISMRSFNAHDSQRLKDASTYTASNEASTCVYDIVFMTS